MIVEIDIEEKLVLPHEVEEIELELGVKFPSDYKDFMLVYNGGSSASTGVYFGGYDDGVRFSSFLPLKYGDDTLEESYLESRDVLPENLTPIGYTGTGFLAMSLGENDYGSVYVYYSDVEPEFLATSFTEFLNGLVDYGDEDQ